MSAFGNLVSEFIAQPLGFAWPDLVLILILLMSIIFFAIGLRSGLVLLWMTLGLLYMIFYNSALETNHVLTLFVVVGVIMIVSMFISHSKSNSGVVGL